MGDTRLRSTVPGIATRHRLLPKLAADQHALHSILAKREQLIRGHRALRRTFQNAHGGTLARNEIILTTTARQVWLFPPFRVDWQGPRLGWSNRRCPVLFSL